MLASVWFALAYTVCKFDPHSHIYLESLSPREYVQNFYMATPLPVLVSGQKKRGKKKGTYGDTNP